MTLLRNLAIKFDDHTNDKRSTVSRRGNSSSSLSSMPKIWYMTTPTQHFHTRNGQYSAKMKGKASSCRLNVTENPRRNLEFKTLTKKTNTTDYGGIRIF